MVGEALEPSPPLRIALLIDSVLARYQVRLFAGARRAARRAQVGFCCFEGGYFTGQSSASVRFDGSFIYALAKRPAVDGIVVVSSILASEVGVDQISDFCRQQGVPVVGVGALPGYPTVQADNRAGLRALLCHLIEDHGHRNLAFIRGARGNPDSQEREAVFRETLEQHGLRVREELILPGDFVEASGKHAMRILCDERGVSLRDVDAVVAANDQMAAGALTELSRRGVQVPQDVAVVGFDDDDHARFSSPPLSTVGQPVELVGERAVELLLAQLQGQPVPARSVVDTEPVLRRSCGCAQVEQPAASDSGDARAALLLGLQATHARCRERAEHLTGLSPARGDCTGLVQAVIASIQGEQPSFDDLKRAVLAAADEGADPLRWHDVVSLIDAEVQRHRHADPQGCDRSERVLTQARWVISEAAARLQCQRQLHTVHRANTLRLLGNALVSAHDPSEFATMLEAALPGLGVDFCCVCLFADERPPFAEARVVALYDRESRRADGYADADEATRTAAESSRERPRESESASGRLGLAFATEHLLPAELCPGVESAFLSVYPLTFARRPLGYVVFNQADELDRGWITDAVSGHLSSAVYVLRQGEKLRRAREVAETASAAKSEFLANMSHEIRTPITAVRGYLDLCLGTSLTVQQQRYLSQAQASSKALLGLVSDLLDFSKIEARKLDLEQTAFSLDGVVDQVASTFAMAAAQKGIELVVDVHSDVPERLSGDPLRLAQVLLNLVGNAVKFTERGQVLFQVQRVGDTGSRQLLRFTVRDTGVGMSRGQLERLARPFTQGDSSMTRRYGGTGLGLAISQRLIAMMGGTLRMHSESGRGSEFEFDIELTVDGPLEQAAQPSVQGRGRRVLVADGSAQQLASIRRQLEAAGFAVQTASCDDEALALLDQARDAGAPFQLALLDVRLPSRAGGRPARRLWEWPNLGPTTILLLAPLNAPELNEPPCGSPRVVGVLAKPLPRSSLLRHVSEALQGRPSLTPAPPGPQLDPMQAAVLRGKRMLLVEDNEISREVARELLEVAGIEVHVATNGSEAVQHVSHMPYDGVLMDLHMPVMDGCEAARAMRSDPRSAHLPIIAMTASALSEDRDRCLAAGMNDHLATPVDPPQLYATLTRWLAPKPGADFAPETEAGPTSEMRALRALQVAAAPRVAWPLYLRSGPGLDTSGGLERVAGNVSLYRRLLRRFLESHQDSAVQIREYVARGEVESAAQRVHSLSGTAGTIGAHEVHTAAFRLEMALRARDAAAQRALSGPVESALQQVLPTIRATLEQLPETDSIPPRGADAELGLQLMRLGALLADFDTAAVDCLEELLPVCRERGVADECDALESRVRAYDFEQALRALEALRSRLDVPR